MRTIFIFALLVIIVTSCEKKIKYNPEYKDELVLNGYISPSFGVDVSLSHTIDPYITIQKEDSTAFIDNAQILLFENNNIIDTLINTNIGKYVSSNNTIISQQNTYHLEVSTPNYSNIKTEILQIPPKVTFEKIEYSPVSFDNSQYYYDSNIDFEVTDNTNEDGFYFVKLSLSKNDTIFRLSSRFYGANNELGCYFSPYTSIGYYFIDQTCFAPNEIKYNIKFNQFTVVNNDLTQGNDTIYTDNLNVLVSKIDPEYFKLIESYNPGKSSQQGFVTPPFTTYTNVINGFGVIIPLNDTIVDFSF